MHVADKIMSPFEGTFLRSLSAYFTDFRLYMTDCRFDLSLILIA